MSPFFNHYDEINTILNQERAKIDMALRRGEGSISVTARLRRDGARPLTLLSAGSSGSGCGVEAPRLTAIAGASPVPPRPETSPGGAT